MNPITKQLLSAVAGFTGSFEGAFNIRENGACAGRQCSQNIQLESKTDAPGLVIRVAPNTKGETVFIPAVVTQGAVNDLVYNDFFIGADADVTVVAGCGVHTEDDAEAGHNGIHRFFLEKGAHVFYEEKHIGTGNGQGKKRIDPVTDATLADDAVLEMDTLQISGVDSSVRKMTASLGARAKLIIKERIMTDGQERAETDFVVSMDGEDSSVDVVSRSVAKGASYQAFRSDIRGNCRCAGHSECDAILMDQGTVYAAPALLAGNVDASLIHEAAIGKIAGEQITKLCTLGLTEEEAERCIIDGFLRG